MAGFTQAKCNYAGALLARLFRLDALQSENGLDTADLQGGCTLRVLWGCDRGGKGAGWPLHAAVKTGIWKALASASHVSQVDTQQAAPNPLHASAHTNTAGENRQTRKAHANTAAQKLTRHCLRCWPLTRSLRGVRGSCTVAGLAFTSSSSLRKVD